MKTKKKELIYIGLLLASILIIYSTYYNGLYDLLIDDVMQKGVLMLTLSRFSYVAVGVVLLAFTAYLCTHMTSYKVGKVFVAYIASVSAGICLIAITDYRYEEINVVVGLLAVISNYLLFYSVGCLTLIFKKQYYRWVVAGYSTAIICEIVGFLIYSEIKNCSLRNLFGKYIIGDYVFTAVFIIISMMNGYKKSTKYSKQQIKLLTAGMVAGILILLVSNFLPTLAVVEVSDQNHQSEMEIKYNDDYVDGQNYSVIQLDNIKVQKDVYPVIVFTGIAIVIIYILIKREYLILDGFENLKCYISSVVYLLLANTAFRFLISNHAGDFFLFNFLLVIPLCFYGHHVLRKECSLYSHNMLEVLEEERQKLSVYLHDEILQSLIAVQHSSDRKDINREVAMLIEDIRNISHNLYPTIAEDLGLEEAVRIFIDEMNIDYNVEIEYQYNYETGILPKGISLVLYRTVKELVTNAIKHSGGNHIYVGIYQVEEGIQCIVSDDGKGFQMPGNDLLLKSPHMGIYTIRKQIEDLRGVMQVTSDISGSKFQIYIPLG